MGGSAFCHTAPCTANAIATAAMPSNPLRHTFLCCHLILVLILPVHLTCRRSNNSGFTVGGGGGYGSAGPRIWFSPVDVFWYLDPYYMRRRRLRQESGQGMNFLEAIFSFVFGDGNPNESYEDRRWRLVRHNYLSGRHAAMMCKCVAHCQQLVGLL